LNTSSKNMVFFLVVKRLSKNVLEQNFNKIKKTYSRIDMRSLLEMGVRSDMVESKNGAVIFKDADHISLNVCDRISVITMLTAKIKSLMKYREIEPLCYETVVNRMEK